MIERQTQKVAETRNHAIGFRRILQDEGRDRVESVEKEMRVKLHLQGLELGLGELGLKRSLLELARAETSIVEKGVHRDNDERGDDQIDVEPEPEVGAVTVEEGRKLPAQT